MYKCLQEVDLQALIRFDFNTSLRASLSVIVALFIVVTDIVTGTVREHLTSALRKEDLFPPCDLRPREERGRSL